MSAAKILIIDDEPNILQVIQAYLEKNGYIVYIAESGATGLHLFENLHPDLVVLDLMLPDLHGEDICRNIRRSSEVPILMLTAKSNEDDMVNGLLIGADDYMTKPFSPRELMARIISLLRRSHKQSELAEQQLLRFRDGHLVIDLEQHEVRVDGQPISLTSIEFKLLVTLAKHPKRVYSRLELINQIQGYTFDGYERTIDVHVKNLRQKLGDDPKKPAYIVTVYGVGYKFQVSSHE
ncbi:response regulator transcription factor [Fodinisporobacter ferrooxydans]|uniref:Response regulator transcription factor n=1 Tax=Fodinisporobacter ferrooxydans TaxID=2901836 RepID=A0ABY4CS42_9BACL|nr:response regulator transcription factor [Alicyclobacillaceae bacterium MYW30-H2]